MTSPSRVRSFPVHIPVFFILLALVSVLLSSPAAAADYELAPRPQWLQPVALPESENLSSGESLHYLLVDTQINVSGEEKERFYRVAMRPLNQQGLQQISSISLGFAPAYEKLVIHDISVLRDGKRRDRLKSAEIKVFQREDELDRGLYAERWTAMLLLKDLRARDVVEYSYTLRGSNPVLGDKFFGRELLAWGVSIERLYISVLSPREKALQVRIADTKKGHEIDIQQHTKGNTVRYFADLRHTEAVRQEDGIPEWLSPLPVLQYSQYADWRQVNDWAHALYRTPGELPEEFARMVAEMEGSPAQKAAVATQWIQNNIRYFGIEHGVNSHRPSAPMETFERRFGDCKDKTVLLVAALRELGIDAHPALVSSVNNLYLDGRLPSPGNFDHVITTFTLDGKRYWVDPTATSQAGSLQEMSLPDFNWALVVDGERDSLTAIEAPSQSQRRARVVVREIVTLADNRKAATFEVTSRYSGWRAEQMRSYTGYRDRETLGAEFLQYYSRYFPSIEILEPIEVIDSEHGNELVLKEKYRLRKVGDDSSGKNMLKLVASNVVETLRLPNSLQRQYPFRLPGDLQIEQTLEVVAQSAADIRWSEKGGGEAIANPWFEFEREVRKDGNRVTVEYRYNSRRKSVSAADFPKYLEQINRVESDLSYVLWLSSASASREERRNRARNLARDLLSGKKSDSANGGVQ
ncbi:DUF3857 domain-containing transglutaminase family protein [Microbulbifer rhizosphaerae]|uniref:Transglutaminase-like putative cysteine protease n=1 Tax=Microbulbifer rhizosphaerae TaxID=1562603 RepID=A0A7W4WAG2_9GAMM|nr:DUF3857 domain-containing transglutaminase family protein [Microbulbifer rhizosphaerae]MBB3060662.1 transglutaminase-like putative cysteine protease [Microbulbifer rhizosphaerae]